MADELVYIPNDDTQNNPIQRFKLVVGTFELNKPTNQNPVKVPKVDKPKE